MNKKIEVDADFLLKLANGLDAVKRRLDHLESHLCEEPEPPPSKNRLQIHATLKNAYSPTETQFRMEQLRLEFLCLMEEYDVQGLEAEYKRK